MSYVDERPERKVRLRAAWLALAGLLVFGLLPAGRADEVSARQVSGSLNVENGVRVLRLWGKPYEQGFAHGYLLGTNIMGLFENVLFDPRVMPDPAMYETMVRGGFLPRAVFSEDERQELAGLLHGITAKVGEEGLKLKRLGRPLDVQDLAAINTLADWIPTACTSFAAWGSQTVDEGTIVARNLDYFLLPGITEEHLVIVYTQVPRGKRPFASLAWPGLIGVYTAMNDDGVFVATHDAPAAKAYVAERIVPRSLALRHVVESVGSDKDLHAALAILQESPAFRGNNFLLAFPYREGITPAAVFEYDGAPAGGGVTMRTPDASENDTPKDTIACTNHYRQRGEPAFCARYQSVADELASAAQKNVKLNSRRALAIISKAAVPTTVHTVIALPNAKCFDVYLAGAGKPAPQAEGVRLVMGTLLDPTKAAGAHGR